VLANDYVKVYIALLEGLRVYKKAAPRPTQTHKLLLRGTILLIVVVFIVSLVNIFADVFYPDYDDAYVNDYLVDRSYENSYHDSDGEEMSEGAFNDIDIMYDYNVYDELNLSDGIICEAPSYVSPVPFGDFPFQVYVVQSHATGLGNGMAQLFNRDHWRAYTPPQAPTPVGVQQHRVYVRPRYGYSMAFQPYNAMTGLTVVTTNRQNGLAISGLTYVFYRTNTALVPTGHMIARFTRIELAASDADFGIRVIGYNPPASASVTVSDNRFVNRTMAFPSVPYTDESEPFPPFPPQDLVPGANFNAIFDPSVARPQNLFNFSGALNPFSLQPVDVLPNSSYNLSMGVQGGLLIGRHSDVVLIRHGPEPVGSFNLNFTVVRPITELDFFNQNQSTTEVDVDMTIKDKWDGINVTPQVMPTETLDYEYYVPLQTTGKIVVEVMSPCDFTVFDGPVGCGYYYQDIIITPPSGYVEYSRELVFIPNYDGAGVPDGTYRQKLIVIFEPIPPPEPFVFYKGSRGDDLWLPVDDWTRLNGAVFEIDRWDAINDVWVHFYTSAPSGDCGVLGRVVINAVFTHDGNYRMRETIPPTGYNIPPGDWRFTGPPAVDAANIAFWENCTYSQFGTVFNFVFDSITEELNLPNIPTRYWPFYKTDWAIYDSATFDDRQYLPGAVFRLYVYNGFHFMDFDPKWGELIGPGMTGPAEDGYLWTFVAERTSGPQGSPMEFPLMPGRYYRLVEAQPPEAAMPKAAQWRLRVESHVGSNPAGRSMAINLLIGNETPPMHGVRRNPIVDDWIHDYVFYIGNMLATFEFYKGHRENFHQPADSWPRLDGAVFELDRWTYDENTNEWGWVTIRTSDPSGTCGILGRVEFVIRFTANARYRIRETVAPPNFNIAPGYWLFETDANRDKVQNPSQSGVGTYIVWRDLDAIGGNTWLDARYVPSEGWHFPNVPTRDWPIYKTCWTVYSDFSNREYLPGATFRLFVYNGPATPGPDMNVLVTSDMIGPAEDGYLWSYVTTRISGPEGSPMMFPMMVGRHYRLIETAPPVGFIPPDGQWHIILSVDGISFPSGIELLETPVGGVLQFVRDVRSTGEYHYIGNMPQVQLPMSGATGMSLLLALSGTTLLASAGVVVIYAKKRGRNSNIRARYGVQL